MEGGGEKAKNYAKKWEIPGNEVSDGHLSTERRRRKKRGKKTSFLPSPPLSPGVSSFNPEKLLSEAALPQTVSSQRAAKVLKKAPKRALS